MEIHEKTTKNRSRNYDILVIIPGYSEIKWASGAHLSHLGPSLDVGCISRPLLGATLTHFGSPWGTLWDPFSELVRHLSLLRRSWDLKMVVFWGGRFRHHFFRRFLINFWSIFGASGTLWTFTICVRGCKNHTFGYVGWLMVLDTLLPPFWNQKWTPKSHCDSLWGPNMVISALF